MQNNTVYIYANLLFKLKRKGVLRRLFNGVISQTG